MVDWDKIRLEEVLDYEQPTKYIVETTDYDDSFKTPVLTAGKSFLLGHTNESKGIFENVPAIIFDDFTTAFHYVDFPFKVKSSAMKILTADEEKADLRFLYYRMGKVRMDKELHKRYWISKFSKVEIPLPPLETQKRIARILDDTVALRDKTKKLLEECDLLSQSIFLEMFGDPVINPKNWSLKNLKKSVLIFKDGPFGSNLKSAHYTEKGVRIIRLQNIGVNEFVDKSKSYVSESHAEKLRNYTCLPGDILIATMGTPNIRACRFPNYLNKALNKADCLQLRPDPNTAIQDYLLFLINSRGFFHLITKFFHGQTRSRVSMGQMAKLSIPIPPLYLQHEFAKKISLVEKQKELAKKELKESENLFNCLLQKAFKGELV